MVPKWYLHDIYMIPTWYLHDTYIMYEWLKSDTYMIHAWYISDTYMIYVWYKHDTYAKIHGIAWYTHDVYIFAWMRHLSQLHVLMCSTADISAQFASHQQVKFKTYIFLVLRTYLRSCSNQLVKLKKWIF